MPRAVLALLLAVLTVVAAVPAAAVVSAPNSGANAANAPADTSGSPATDVRAGSNTTNYLALGPETVEKTRVDAVSLDAMGSVAVDDGRIHGQYAFQRLQRAYLNAPNESARQAVVQSSADRLERRVEGLLSRERDALAAYNNGELSTGGYLRELAAVDSEARELERAIEQLHSYNQAVGGPVRTERLARLQVALLTVRGPVRARIADAMTGDGSPEVRVFVQTSETGVVLSMVVPNGLTTDYVREAYLGSALDIDGESLYGTDEAQLRVYELYPWIEQHNTGLNTLLSTPRYTRAGVYGIAFDHPQGAGTGGGDLLVFLDRGTDEVFREYQYQSVDQIPTRTLAATTSEGLRVQLNGNRVGGPLEISVVNATTGDPVIADVSVAGRQLGTVREDGRLWTVAPRASFDVTVRAGTRTVTFRVNAAEIEPESV